MLETRVLKDSSAAKTPRDPRGKRTTLIVICLLGAVLVGWLVVRAVSGGDQQLSAGGSEEPEMLTIEEGPGLDTPPPETPVADPPAADPGQVPAGGQEPVSDPGPAPPSSDGQTATTEPAPEPAAGASTPAAQADEKPPAVAPSPPPDSPEGQSLRSRTGPVCLTGLFATVFGGPGQVYFLTEDSGRQTQILLDEKVAAPVGGPLALDRQRVTIRGEAAGVTGAGDPQVRATSVSLGGGCG